MEYKPTIGLEIHAELKTNTKMFCSCRNTADEKFPNVNICPVCMAHPGTLPVINRDAVRKVLLVGMALGSNLAEYTEFDRKNYFYPDIPKGYQISQYAYPLVKGGSLQGVEITRIHLEEDTARSQHLLGVQGSQDSSLVDYNRAGVPLMELVTEPVIHDADMAGSFARELQLLLRYLGTSHANMEKGEMRVEANISVSKTDIFGTKVEVKNLNSFRAVERAIAYEIRRQVAVLEGGGVISQETRGWDEAKQATFSQRKKESSEDYRYFPEPDLPKLVLSEIPELSKEALSKEIAGKLPWERRNAYIAMGLTFPVADLFVREVVLADFFDVASRGLDLAGIFLAASYISNDVAAKREAREIDDAWFTKNNARRFKEVIDLIQKDLVSSRGAKDTLDRMFTDERSPKIIAEENGLIQQSDETFLRDMVISIIETNPTVVAQYKAGKEAALQFLVGKGMKESKGSANPQILIEEFKQALAK